MGTVYLTRVSGTHTPLPPGKRTGSLFLLAAWISIGLAPVLAAQQEAIRLQRSYEELDLFIAAQMEADGTPGMAVGLTAREGLLRVSTYGCADRTRREPVVADTLFEIGSISKSFTAIALLQLHEQGQLDLHAPISRYLPWFSVQSEFDPITPHHLLTHTAGIPRDRDDVPSSLYQALGLRERMTGSTPGSYFAYSNIGYQVLGYLVEALAQRPYPQVIRERILVPLGMRASEPAITYAIRPRLAVGYESSYDDRPSHPTHPLAPATWIEYGAGDGSIASTAADLSAYLRMLLNRGAGPDGRILSEASFALLTQRTVQDGPESEHYYGYGIGIRLREGHEEISHSGGMLGYSSMLLGDLTDGLGVVVLVNGPGRIGAVARTALQLVQAALKGEKIEAPKPREPWKVEQPGDFAGTFRTADGKELRIEAKDSAVVLQLENQTVALEHRGEDQFLIPHPDFALHLLRFGRDQDGAVVEASFGVDWYLHPRYSGARAFDMPEAYRAYPGHYRSQQPWFTNFRIVLRKGELWLIAPSGDEEPLEPLAGGEALFRVGADKESAERLRFDSVVNGKALRATLSGVAYYRTFTP